MNDFLFSDSSVEMNMGIGCCPIVRDCFLELDGCMVIPHSVDLELESVGDYAGTLGKWGW